jgi:hypothetical protein|tara:strand:+ start:205 stop:504 length:300 start_codon:yes stop_codon:yes gene_type:complete
MKTIVDENNVSKFLVADDYSVVISADNIAMGNPSTLDFYVNDMNSTNCTLIEGVTTPDDWFGCKYTCAADGTWSLVEGWNDTRIPLPDIPPPPPLEDAE